MLHNVDKTSLERAELETTDKMSRMKINKNKAELLKSQQRDSGFIEDVPDKVPTVVDTDEVMVIDDHEDYEEDEVSSEEGADQVATVFTKGAPLLVSPATKRRVHVTNYYFLDYYYDLLSYLHHRKLRVQEFKDSISHTHMSATERSSKIKEFRSQETALLRLRRTRTKVGQFSVLAQIGQGGYGEVFLAKKKDTNEICALKKMSKKVLHKMGEVEHILTERDVLVQTSSAWLVKLLYAFQDLDNVYLAMEYVPGGDVRTLLNNSGILREKDAKFYMAEMLTAVGHLHELGYIHRDLKPENFLIDQTGHIKLIDFGLSKGRISEKRFESLRMKLAGLRDSTATHYSTIERRKLYNSYKNNSTRAFTLVGSPDYMAPEVILCSTNPGRNEVYASGYDYLVDYWALGCILFEFLAGYPPFTGPTNEEVWINVYHWQEVLERPNYTGSDAEFNMTDDAWSLISSLITHRHKRPKNLSEVQIHSWFRSLNDEIQMAMSSMQPRMAAEKILWGNMRDIPQKLLKPPFIPKLNGEGDTRHFDDFTSPEAIKMYTEVLDKKKKLDEEAESVTTNRRDTRALFTGFTFKHKGLVRFQRQ